MTRKEGRKLQPGNAAVKEFCALPQKSNLHIMLSFGPNQWSAAGTLAGGSGIGIYYWRGAASMSASFAGTDTDACLLLTHLFKIHLHQERRPAQYSISNNHKRLAAVLLAVFGHRADK
jgi:hypothetical protein